MGAEPRNRRSRLKRRRGWQNPLVFAPSELTWERPGKRSPFETQLVLNRRPARKGYGSTVQVGGELHSPPEVAESNSDSGHGGSRRANRSRKKPLFRLTTGSNGSSLAGQSSSSSQDDSDIDAQRRDIVNSDLSDAEKKYALQALFSRVKKAPATRAPARVKPSSNG